MRTPVINRCIPVLSEQMTEIDPRASTECNFLTMAFLLDMRSTPKASVTVVTIGKPSGIAATARDTTLEQRAAESSHNMINPFAYLQ